MWVWQFGYPSYSRRQKTQAVNYVIPSESMDVFPYPSSFYTYLLSLHYVGKDYYF